MGKMSLEPPTYTPSAAVPAYSVVPRPTERILAATTRSRRRAPTGILVRSNGLITIALREQEQYAQMPSYSQHGAIYGDIGLSCTHGVQSVYVKLEGRLHLAKSDGAVADLTFFSMLQDVWRRTDAGGRGTCPSTLPFETMLPNVFVDNGERRALPPTYNHPLSEADDVRAQCRYFLWVVVERKGSKFALWKHPKKLRVPFVYRPRARPRHPMLSSPFPFLSTVKSLPEEWFQITTTMSPKATSDMELEPIDCHLFVPVAQTFAVTDTIRFYLQLIAPSKSLQAFLYPTTPTHTKHKRSKSNIAESTALPTVRVYLQRHVIIVIKGQQLTRRFPIGEGKVCSLPPSASPPSMLRSQPLSHGLSSLDYEGEVRANPDITVGQFTMSKLQVRDSITIALSPPNPNASPLKSLQYSHPIRLVTDPFTDNVIH